VNSTIEQLLTFKEENPDDPFILYALAMEYKKNKVYQSAEKYYQILVDKHPQYGGTYYHYAQLLETIGEVTRANSIYEKGLSILKENKDSHLYNELGQAYENFKLNAN